MYHPPSFVSAFTDILPSILKCHISPSPNIRVLACHATTALFLASTRIPLSPTHTRMATAIKDHLKPPVGSSPTAKPSPSVIVESPLVRMLRVTLNVPEAQHVGQGPVWALIVLANFIGLLRSMAYLEEKSSRIITSLLSLACRHPNAAIRSLSFLVRRLTVWAYFSPVLPMLKFSPGYDVKSREAWWAQIKSIVDMGLGLGIVGGIMAEGEMVESSFERITDVLRQLIRRSNDSFDDCLEAFSRLLTQRNREIQWNINGLLPLPLFDGYPEGILSPERGDSSPGKLSHKDVVSMLARCPDPCEDIRALTKEELSEEWTLPQLAEVWREAISCVGIYNRPKSLVSDPILSHIFTQSHHRTRL
jgi:hypothetical protein